LKEKKTATRALTEIKLEEPPKSLFEIPTDYTVEDQRNKYPWNQSTEEQKTFFNFLRPWLTRLADK
jgi:hypothetical protein